MSQTETPGCNQIGHTVMGENAKKLNVTSMDMDHGCGYMSHWKYLDVKLKAI